MILLSLFTLHFLLFTFCEANTSTSWIIFRKLKSPKPRPIPTLTTIKGDLSGIIYNPSILATITQQEIFTMTELGLANDYFIGVIYGHPINLGNAISAGVVSYDAGKTTIYRFDPVNQKEVEITTSLQNDLLGIVSYAKTLRDKLHAGISLKFSISRIADTKTAYAFVTDIGCSYLLLDDLILSAALQNLGTSTKFLEQTEKLPTSIWSGIGYKYKLSKGVNPIYIIISADLPYMVYESRITPSIGFEIGRMPVNIYLGYRFNVKDSMLSVGLGLNLKNFNLNYSYTPAKWLNPAHSLSFGIRFGKVLPVVQKQETEIPMKPEVDKVPVEPKKQEVDPVPVKPTKPEIKPVPVKPTEQKVEPVPTKPKELTDEEKLSLMRKYWADGIKYYQNGEYEKAIKEFEKILRIKPDHPQSLRLILKCKEKLSQKK